MWCGEHTSGVASTQTVGAVEVKLAAARRTLPATASYYFADNGTSVKAALKDAGLVDIDAMLAQAVDGKDQVEAGITANYTFRWAARPARPIGLVVERRPLKWTVGACWHTRSLRVQSTEHTGRDPSMCWHT